MNDNQELTPVQQIYVKLSKQMSLLADTLTNVMELVTELVKGVEDGSE